MRAFVSCFVAVIAISGCGGSKKSSTDGGADAAVATGDLSAAGVTTACTAEANALCALRNTCSPEYGIQRTWGTLTVCETRTAQNCVNALDAKGTGNTTTQVDACAAAYANEACTDYFDSNPIAECVPMAGTLGVGTACGSAAQCSTTYCAIPQYSVCGVCAALPVAGATCEVQADCGRDLACVMQTAAENDGGISTSGTCTAFVAPGGSCLTGRNPCQGGYACVGENVVTQTTGTCQALATTVGASCDSSRKTAANCDVEHDVVCIPTAAGSGVGTCKAITFANAGATCGTIGSAPITGEVACAAGGQCIKAVSTDATGTCAAPAADGAACDNDPSIGPPCLNPARCVVTGSGTAGTCVFPNAATCM